MMRVGEAVEKLSKQERYFTGMPLETDPSKPLPGEMPPSFRRGVRLTVIAILTFAAGVGVGISLGGETPEEAAARIEDLEAELLDARGTIRDLNRALVHKQTGKQVEMGRLSRKDRNRHEREGRRYAAALRKAKAQSAAGLILWFVERWNTLLDKPAENDRLNRRAEVLAQLVGGMAQHLNPGDYVAWQADFMSGKWLGELHFDLDKDGYPARRKSPNPKDGFVDKSVCHVAMALNLTIADAQVLVQPQMRCDSPRAKISIFFQGKTLDDNLDHLARELKKDGFFVSDRNHKGVRMVLIGPGRRAQ